MPGEAAAAPTAAEPLFKYSRAVGKLDALLPPNAAITTAVVHPPPLLRLQALGTTAGTVHILELGASGATEWRRLQAHQGAIVDMCLDAVRGCEAGPG
jgi:hypothetical protein